MPDRVAAGGKNAASRWPLLCGAGLLMAAVLAVYAQVHGHGFIDYDDPGYVRDNPVVRRGLSALGVQYAFTTGLLGNWIPLTWLSHMLDVQLFGLEPGAHHLVSVAIHLVNTLLLFWVLARMTGAPWPSLVVAAWFGVHPLHVESVAWISERKDVLSTFFWFVTLATYTRYVETKARRWYAATIAALAAGLLAKPMLVTLPFLLLLLDLWPYGRIAWPDPPRRGARNRASHAVPFSTAFSALAREKLPLFAVVVIASVLAYVMQLQSGAMPATGKLSIGDRIANALVSYVRYLGMMVWPADLAVLYPFDVTLPLWQPIAAAALLIAVSLLVVRLARPYPYLLVGWFWYLGTLVPVIGLVQIGSQALADRYTYVPLIGVFIMIAWGGRDLVHRWSVPAPVTGALIAAITAAYAVAAWAQVGRWRDSETLLAHTLSVTRGNAVAHNNLGVALGARGDNDGAREQFLAAVRIKTDYGDPYNNLGLLFWRQGQREQAVAQYRTALRYTPQAAETRNNLGLVLTELGRYDDAIAELSEAIRLDPYFAVAHNNLGKALRDSGRRAEALEHYAEAKRIRPDYADPYNNVGTMLAEQGNRDAAVAEFRTALQHDPQSIDAHNNLGLVLAELGQTEAALESLRTAVRLAPDAADVRRNLANVLRDDGRLPEAIGEYERALALQPDVTASHHEYGVALIGAGRTPDAIPHIRRALELTPDYAPAHNDLGVALVETGQVAEAIPHFERALQLDPALPDAQYNLEVARGMAQAGQQGQPRP